MWSDLAKRCCFLFLLFFVFAALGLVAGIWADTISETNLPPSSQPMPTTEPQPTQALQSLETAWSALKAELSQSETDWQAVLLLLQQLQIEAKELRSSLNQSTEQLATSKASFESERDALKTALVISKRETTISQIIACVAAIAALIGWIL